MLQQLLYVDPFFEGILLFIAMDLNVQELAHDFTVKFWFIAYSIHDPIRELVVASSWNVQTWIVCRLREI